LVTDAQKLGDAVIEGTVPSKEGAHVFIN